MKLFWRITEEILFLMFMGWLLGEVRGTLCYLCARIMPLVIKGL